MKGDIQGIAQNLSYMNINLTFLWYTGFPNESWKYNQMICKLYTCYLNS